MSHNNAALAFDKLNLCLLDVQEWMLSSMLKLNPAKQSSSSLDLMLKKLDSHLPVRIFGNFMHPAVVKNLDVWFDVISLSLIMSAIFVRHGSFKCMISGRFDVCLVE